MITHYHDLAYKNRKPSLLINVPTANQELWSHRPINLDSLVFRMYCKGLHEDLVSVKIYDKVVTVKVHCTQLKQNLLNFIIHSDKAKKQNNNSQKINICMLLLKSKHTANTTKLKSNIIM